MEKCFFVTDGLNRIGPFDKDEILKMLFAAQISLTDSILDSRDNILLPVLQHMDFGGDGNFNSSVNKQPIIANSIAKTIDFSTLRATPLNSGKSPNSEKKINKTDPDKTSTSANARGVENKQSGLMQTTPTTQFVNTNTNMNFYLKLNKKEYGPFRFLILLSLYQQKKISLESDVRSESDQSWKKLADILPTDLQNSVHMMPIMNSNVLPKNFWKRKNLRLDFEEMVIIANDTYSLVGRSIDLSTDGMAIVWVYDVPLEQEFLITLFDLKRNLVQIKGKLTRKESIPNSDKFPIFKAVFMFLEKLEIKNFIS